MVKVEAKETFTFGDYEKVEVVLKKGSKPNEFTKGDIFICNDEIALYLDGNNPIKRSVINVLEVIPPETAIKEETQKPKNTTKSKSKKIDKKIK